MLTFKIGEVVVKLEKDYNVALGRPVGCVRQAGYLKSLLVVQDCELVFFVEF